MDEITKKMKIHYSETFEKYGANVRGVDWGGGEVGDIWKLNLRYEKMLEVITDSTKGDISILDVGCGYGGLYQFALDKGLQLDYTGIDVCRNMIHYATNHNQNGVFICEDILAYDPQKKFDYVICNGILTQKLGAGIREMDIYARKLIHRMWDLSNRGIVFNIMKSQVDFMKESLYYKSPLEIMGFCMTLTDKFIVDSAYPLYEYCVYLYHSEQ